MLRNRKLKFVLRAEFAFAWLLTITWHTTSASDEIPAGHDAARYKMIWERNPFTLVTPAARNVQPNMFDKLVLVSWLNNGGKDVVIVQNTDTNEVQKVTTAPNSDRLRLISIRKDPDPKKSEVVLSNGAEQGTVRFRMEVAQPIAQNQMTQPLPGQNAGARMPMQPGVPQQSQRFKNAMPPNMGRMPPQMQGQGQGQTPEQNNANISMQPPRASEYRRKRITAPPANEQPVDAGNQAQNVPVQPQLQPQAQPETQPLTETQPQSQ